MQQPWLMLPRCSAPLCYHYQCPFHSSLWSFYRTSESFSLCIQYLSSVISRRERRPRARLYKMSWLTTGSIDVRRKPDLSMRLNPLAKTLQAANRNDTPPPRPGSSRQRIDWDKALLEAEYTINSVGYWLLSDARSSHRLQEAAR